MVVLLVGLFVWLQIAWPAERVKQAVEAAFSNRFKADLTIDKLGYGWHFNVVIAGLKVTANKKPVILADSLSLQIDPALLLQQKIFFRSVIFEKTRFFLSGNRKRGRYKTNWDFLFSSRSKKKRLIKKISFLQKLIARISWKEIKIEDSVLILKFKAIYPESGKYHFNFAADQDDNTLRLQAKVHLEKNAHIEIKAEYFITLNANNLKDFIYSTFRGHLTPGNTQIRYAMLPSRYLVPFVAGLRRVQKLNGTMHIDHLKSGRLNLRFENLRVLNKKPSIWLTINGKAAYSQKSQRLTSHGLSLRAGKSIHAKINSLLLSKGRLRKIKVEVSGDFSDLNKLIKLTLPLRGLASGDVEFKNNIWKGKIKVTDFSAGKPGHPVFAARSMLMKLKGKSINIGNTPVNILSQPAQFSANIFSSRKADLKVRFKNLDLLKMQTLIKAVKNNGNIKKEKNRSQNLAGRIKIHFSADIATYSALKMTNFISTVTFLSSKISFSPISFRLAGGKVNGSYSLHRAQNRHSYKLSFNRVKASRLADMMEAKFKIFADLNGRVAGAMSGFSVSEFKKSLEADVFLESSSGSISGTGLQEYVRGILGPLEDKLARLNFESMSLRLSFSKQNIYLESARFNSFNLKGLVSGRFNWQKKGQARAVLKFTRQFVQDVANPAMLGITGNLSGEWYTLPFGCRGDISVKSCWQRQW